MLFRSLRNLVIEPNEEREETGFDNDEAGRILVPVGRVQAVKDHMIVEQ